MNCIIKFLNKALNRKNLRIRPEYDERHIDCLLNPEEYSAVGKGRECTCEEEK